MTDDATMIADLRAKAEKAETAAVAYCATQGANARGAEFFAVKQARDQYWRALIEKAPRLLNLASTAATAREAGRREGIEAAANVATYQAIQWKARAQSHTLAGPATEAWHRSDQAQYIATAIETLALGGSNG